MSPESASPDVLLVVATLGRRPEFLDQTLHSIRSQGVPADVVIVTPLPSDHVSDLARRFDARILPDPGSLPAAINFGIDTYGSHYRYVNWLNDDDLLEPGSLGIVRNALERNAKAVAAFGACRYIDSQGQQLWISRAGRLAPWILRWGPDLIPQPGMLIRMDAWRAVGGLNTSYAMAFDLDLLLRLQKVGPLINTGRVVSSFRWHPDSLTVDGRTQNLEESERAKRAALPPALQHIAWLWERPVRGAIRIASWEVNRRARQRSAG